MAKQGNRIAIHMKDSNMCHSQSCMPIRVTGALEQLEEKEYITIGAKKTSSNEADDTSLKTKKLGE